MALRATTVRKSWLSTPARRSWWGSASSTTGSTTAPSRSSRSISSRRPCEWPRPTAGRPGCSPEPTPCASSTSSPGGTRTPALSWPSGSAPRRARPCTPPAGEHTQMLVNQTALDIQAGRADLVLLGGAEAWRSRMAARKAGRKPNWTLLDDSLQPTRTLGRELNMNHQSELARESSSRCRCTRSSTPRSERLGVDAGRAPRPAGPSVVPLQRGGRRQPPRLDPGAMRPRRSASRHPTTGWSGSRTRS